MRVAIAPLRPTPVHQRNWSAPKSGLGECLRGVESGHQPGIKSSFLCLERVITGDAMNTIPSRAFCIVGVLLIAGCSAQSDAGLLDGRWTPVASNDCSGKGLVVVVRDKFMGIETNGRNTALGAVDSISKNPDGTVDLNYRPVLLEDGAKSLATQSEKIRFEVKDHNRVRAVARSRNGQDFEALPPQFEFTFDMQRCAD
jgi:hypothetical protein